MRTVKNKAELLENFKTIDEMLAKKKDPEYTYALNLIEKGTCFVAVQSDDDNYKFYPSRFSGYLSNTMNKHENNHEKDGRVTNSAIKELLGCKPELNPDLELKYKSYCEQLGFIARDKGAFGAQRKFWNFT